MKHLLLAALFLCSCSVICQTDNITSQLYDTYENYKEGSIGKRRIKRADIQPLIDNFTVNDKFKVQTVGKSIGGKKLSLISIGSGETNVFLWSQMHGDEPTATQAIFDILNFFNSANFKKEKEEILANLTIHFLPMLNPDGAELFQRRNLLGIDINRDALRLQSPESKTLKRVRDSLNADFGFNLHDQSTYYNAERTEKPATISYLAPAYNYEKDINETRGNAMKIIVFMNNILQKYAPGQVGRYNDDFEPRAFGDNIQKWGTSTILIESGGYPNDIEKQEIRKLNYTSILSAIYTIAKKSYETIAIEKYEEIPENDRKLFDLKITGASYNLMGNTYVLDLGINQIEVDYPDHNSFWYSSRILDQGDLFTYYGYETLDATGYTIKQAKVYPRTLNSFEEVKALNFNDILKQGFGYVRLSTFPAKRINSPFPVHLIGAKYNVPELNLSPGINPTFFLEKNGVKEYAVINGFLVNLKKTDINVPNSMIFR
ncbi:M14 family metallopeptidase [Maribacter sp. 1_2014MBL_MicDiv]|uniref:M14 family metallopeptidase n=1 Tax=Maribacter sp. 1_2014MBL_MicDiv TaxID=1644130 RepID=UPI0008F50258|nr:M14 metallopeptidase family protein [Maribacter sp. 1_2014MBL_MicDiv]APA65916.1 peptidase M14 [Maribacter sp. 1_2014MBL_MicDiv]